MGSGNFGFGYGLFDAPNGDIDIEGNESLWCMQLAALRI